jgi:hypothetical protein
MKATAFSAIGTGVKCLEPVICLLLTFLRLLSLLAIALAAPAQTIGNHPAVYDAHGTLLPWTPWRDAIQREVNWYLNCPVEHGYPRFVYLTFMDGNYELLAGNITSIPATQDGMGIISYLKYYAWQGKKDPRVLQIARYMGDYLVKEDNTPDDGKYPRFPRSTGLSGKFPQPPDCGSQGDKPCEVQPDKGGIAGYALVLLYQETGDDKYLQQALHNARVLAANMVEGTATNSPWPFRVDYRNGAGRGAVSGNMTFILRLFDALIGLDHREFQMPRDRLWAWIRTFQLPDLAKDGMLWVQFFEDHTEPDNRTAWAPLNLARYLLEKREALDPDWQKHARALITFTNDRFTSIYNGVLICGEQTYDRQPWGGILSTYGAVLAMYSKATGSNEFKGLARQALNYCLYAVNDDGCPGEQASGPGRGGWQEDAHTDKLHNVLDAIGAFPEWAN